MNGKKVVVRLFFFFASRRRHTRYWRDWSSDVCSSDLDRRRVVGGQRLDRVLERLALVDRGARGADAHEVGRQPLRRQLERRAGPGRGLVDRKSVVQGKSVDLGGRRIIKKKQASLLSAH